MLGRAIRAPQVRSVMKGSRFKYANLVRITHRDEVEAPITDWLREAYGMHDALLQRHTNSARGTTKDTEKNRENNRKKRARGRRARA